MKDMAFSSYVRCVGFEVFLTADKTPGTAFVPLGGSTPTNVLGGKTDQNPGRSALWPCFGRVLFPCLVSRIFLFFLGVSFSPH